MTDWTRLTIYGTPIDALTKREIQDRINRAMEQAADALRYGGPAYAKMWQDEAAKFIRELDRRP